MEKIQQKQKLSGNGKWKIILCRLRCHLVLFLSLLIFLSFAGGKGPLSIPTHFTLRKSMNDTRSRTKIECKKSMISRKRTPQNTSVHSLYCFHTLFPTPFSHAHFKTMRSQTVLFSFLKINSNLFNCEMCAISKVFSTFISLFTILAKEKCLFFHFVKSGKNAFQNSYVLKTLS